MTRRLIVFAFLVGCAGAPVGGAEPISGSIEDLDRAACKDEIGFFGSPQAYGDCRKRKDAEHRAAEQERVRAADAARVEAARAEERRMEAETERLRAEYAAKEAERKAERERIKAEQEERYQREEAVRKAEVARLQAKAAAEAEEERKADEAKRKKCGKDYMRIAVGMSFSRVKQCSGEFFLQGQVNRRDGVASVYESGDWTVVVRGNRVVAWQSRW